MKRFVPCTMVALLAFAHVASAQEAPAADDATVEARKAFADGAALLKSYKWGEALVFFERAEKLKPHAITKFDIGICFRGMGAYTRARASFKSALDANQAAGGAQLGDAIAKDADGYVKELDGLLARAEVTLQPVAKIAVDGRPLEIGPDGIATAGTRDPAPAEDAPAEHFTLVIDPGPHLIVLSRAGYADAVVNQTFLPGAKIPLKLKLDTLPATISVQSTPSAAILSLNGFDVGTAPVELTRPAGTYRLLARQHGYTPYAVPIVVRPGEHLDIQANLQVEEKSPIYLRWWFITGAAVILGGAILTTYLVAHDQQRPAPNGGSLGWAVNVAP